MNVKKISILLCFGLLSLPIFSQVQQKTKTVSTESKYEKDKVKPQVTPKETNPFPNWLIIRTGSSSRCSKDKIEFILNKGGYLSYEWNFGDGSFATTASPRSNHVFNQSGSYLVSCLIKNKDGRNTTKKITVAISTCK